ncbi:MAG: hypothetical protein ACI4OH_05230 [Mitsuokella sp.]|uniref:hypothetical protein n=1 Tax=Mitsuokella sp. TaxID=2049034 RepID=UPI003F0C54EB
MKMIAKTSLLFLFISAFLVLGWAFHEEPRLQEEAIRHMEMFSIHKADAIHFVRDADTKPIASRIFFWPGRTLFEIFPSERSLFHA